MTMVRLLRSLELSAIVNAAIDHNIAAVAETPEQQKVKNTNISVTYME